MTCDRLRIVVFRVDARLLVMVLSWWCPALLGPTTSFVVWHGDGELDFNITLRKKVSRSAYMDFEAVANTVSQKPSQIC